MTAIPYLYQSNATDRDHRRSSYFLERESSDVGGTYAEEIRMATMIPMTAPSNSPESEDIMDSTRSAGIESAQTDVGTQRVGVLSTHNSEETKAILNAVRVLGHEPVWIRDENVTSWIEDGTVQLSPRVDVFVNRMLPTTSDHQLEDLQPAALYEETTPVINPAQAVANTLHKYRAGVKLAEATSRYRTPVSDGHREPSTSGRSTSRTTPHTSIPSGRTGGRCRSSRRTSPSVRCSTTNTRSSKSFWERRLY